VYKHERGQKVKSCYPDEMIAKEDKREKEKKCIKRGATQKQEKHENTLSAKRERKERKK